LRTMSERKKKSAKIMRAYCPVCKKFVPDEEIFPVVVEVRADGSEHINRAFHYPGCVGMGELEPREYKEVKDE